MTSKTYLTEHVDRYLDIDLPVARNFTASSYKSYVTSLLMVLEYTSATLKCPTHKIKSKSLTYHLLYDFMTDTKERKSWKPATWNTRLSGIKSFVEFLSAEDPRFLDTYRRLRKIKNQKVDRNDPFYLNKEQLDASLKVSRPNSWIGLRDYTIIQFMLKTGLRAFEVRNLKHDDILYLSSKTVHVRFRGKGRKERVVPVVDSGLIKTMQNFFHNPVVNSQYCFPSRSGSHMSESNLSDRVTRFFKKHDIAKKVTPHDLRRSAAMSWLRQGMSVYNISNLLGHEDIATTQIYLKLDPEEREADLRRIAVENGEFHHPKFKYEDDDLIKSIKMRIRRSQHLVST